MKMPRNDKIHEFCRIPYYRVPRVTGHWNRPCSQKPCAIAHENSQKWQKHEFCRLPNYRVPCSQAVEVVLGAETMRYSPWERQEMRKFTSFVDFRITFYRGSRAVEIVPETKLCAIAHENGQKWQNSWILSTSKLPCTGCHRPLKFVPEAKTVCYIPWKRPEMTKFMSSVDFQITVYRGSRDVEVVLGAETMRYSPWKRPEMTKFTSFVDFQITVYRGSRAVEVVQGAETMRWLHIALYFEKSQIIF